MKYVLAVVSLAVTFWLIMLHGIVDQHDTSGCPITKVTMLSGRPHFCTFVTEDELRCYPTTTLCP